MLHDFHNIWSVYTVIIVCGSDLGDFLWGGISCTSTSTAWSRILNVSIEWGCHVQCSLITLCRVLFAVKSDVISLTMLIWFVWRTISFLYFDAPFWTRIWCVGLLGVIWQQQVGWHGVIFDSVVEDSTRFRNSELLPGLKFVYN